MDFPTAVGIVRSRIRDLSSLQRKGKRARKTTIPASEREALLRDIGLVGRPNYAAQAVMDRRGVITAHLNFLHEIRGSEHRHGVKKGTDYAYDEAIADLRFEIGISMKA